MGSSLFQRTNNNGAQILDSNSIGMEKLLIYLTIHNSLKNLDLFRITFTVYTSSQDNTPVPITK
jgi:hypothetical protein